jgi:hypothetical protein
MSEINDIEDLSLEASEDVEQSVIETEQEKNIEEIETVVFSEEKEPATKKVAKNISVKANITEAKEEDLGTIISSPKPKGKRKPALAPVRDGAIGAASIEVAEKLSAKIAKPEQVKSGKVAVYSTKNVTWSGVGKVYRGYNIVTEDQAAKWLTRDHTRLATPEEVAKEFGND